VLDEDRVHLHARACEPEELDVRAGEDVLVFVDIEGTERTRSSPRR